METLLKEMSFEPALKKKNAHSLSRPSLSYWQDAWIRLKKNKQAFVSLFIIVILLLFTGVGPFLWQMDPTHQDLNRISEKPSLGKSAVVLGELEPWEEIIASEGGAQRSLGSAGELSAPEKLELIGIPSTQAIRLKWSLVAGASGYALYRGEREPSLSGSYGVPLAQVEGGNHISYEDSFNLENKTYYYTVIAKGSVTADPLQSTEGTQAKTIKVIIPSTISLDDAKLLSPNANVGAVLDLPAHPLGTDYLGRDLLSRLMQGARISLFIGFFSPFLATLIGIFIGGVAGYFGGRVDHWLMRATDFVLALPFLLFMILFKVVLGAQAGESGVTAMLIALVILSWTGVARLTRGQVLQLRESEFVQASRLLGAKPFYIILRHLLPNTLGVILVSLTFSIPTAIFTEAFLSFIGMGVVPPTPSWGSMCNDGIQTFLTHPHEFLFPALVISITVLAFNLLGDGLRDALDPKLRSR